MGSFTGTELQNAANALLDYYMKGPALAQTIQERPLMAAMKAAQKTFPGGKEMIRGNVKGDYTTEFMGYSFDDTVTYANPANIKQFAYPWYEIHAGIVFTGTELKKAGITIVDTLDGAKTSDHSEQDKIELTNLLMDKLDDMGEGSARSFNLMLLRDGTQSALLSPGLQHVLPFNPTSGTRGGLDSASLTWWRNRARTSASSGGSITHSTSLQTLTKTLRAEARQLRRYGGKPQLWIGGSGFIEKLEAEVFEKGTYTQEGFINRGKNDIGMAEISMRGVGTYVYDPTFDDEGLSNYSYMIDTKHTYPMVMQGEDMKQHTPARPHDKYSFYRAVTWTGNACITRKPNANGVYQAA
jgi:hypothetical protein